VWTSDFAGLGAKAFERFDEDGWMRFRMRMPLPPTAGTYERRGDQLTMVFDAKPETLTMTTEADRLRLASEGKTDEYRYVGTSAWYMPATAAK
jgi:sporulation-control protein spo0M